MVSPISNSGPGAVDTQKLVKASPAPATTSGKASVEGAASTPAARLASLGPPIDVTRVGEIKAAIAQGSYTVDADRLAAAMLALDLPRRDA
jgi:negative regulator of flagellin synthesis FlgM